MKVLAIETSCDETGICILEEIGGEIRILGNALASQIEIHAQYGGVFPALAKRAHAEKFVHLLSEALTQAGMLKHGSVLFDISWMDDKDATLRDTLTHFFASHARPDIDYIAVTVGPGLEPALWVGVNAARALASVWNIPVIPINHMEGHIITAAITALEPGQNFVGLAGAQPRRTEDIQNSVLAKRAYQFTNLQFPVLSLLVSGGHTELVIAESFGTYKKIGATRDDAVGEAFDKVARVLGLPYPGGPAVSRLAKEWREAHSDTQNEFTLPRPMLHSGDYDFSFSGIKTAVLYAARDSGELSENQKLALAAEFETAAIEVLVKKTLKAAQEFYTPTIIVGGGVAGNTYLRSELKKTVAKQLPDTVVLFPEPWLATDNAVMIGLAAMTHVISEKIKTRNPDELRADGNLSL